MEQARQVLLLVQPPTPASLTRLGVLEMRQGRMEVAHRRLEEATKLATKNSVPSLSDTAIILARSLVKEGDTSKASEVITSALSTDSGNSELYRELVSISELKNNFLTTITVCKNAIRAVGSGDKIFFKKEVVRQAELNCFKEEEIIMLEESNAKPVSVNLKCNVCGVILSSKGNLSVHKRIHNKVNSTFCKKCLIEFNNDSALKCHVVKCRKYVCECGFVAKKSSIMKSHKLTHK